jgi:hypothetical protein
MADSIRELIIQSIVSRLADIRTSKGYQTEAGKYVFRGIKRLDEAYLPACAVWAGEEIAETIYDSLSIEMPIRVELLSFFADENPSVIGERLLADVIECLLSSKRIIAFESGVSSVSVGNTIIGATSGDTGYVEAVSISSGSWAGNNTAGTITARRCSGTFAAGEILKVGDTTKCTVASITNTDVVSNVITYGQGINYQGGGYDNYPESGESVIMVTALFHIKYTTKEGNPYSE